MRYCAINLSWDRSIALVVLSLSLLPFAYGQIQSGDRWFSIALGSKNEKERWQRVSTEDGFLSEVDSQSLAIGRDRTITVRFRMSFAKPERLTTSSAKYKSREDTIQFDAGEGRYRILESSYLDGSGKLVASSGATDWKPLRSGLGSRLYGAAARLRPFGEWSVHTYRYASGEPASSDDPPDLRNLIKSYVLLRPDRFVAGRQTCDSPVLEGRTMTDEEYSKRIGSPLKAIGIPSDKVDTVIVNCSSGNSFPSNTILLRIPDGKIAMLWSGVFLELEDSR